VRNKSASLPRIHLVALLPPLITQLAPGIAPPPKCAVTCGCSRSYSRPPRCLLPRSHAARPGDRGENCRMLLALVRSRTPSPASALNSGRRSQWLPCARPFRYIWRHNHLSCLPWGEAHSCQRCLSLKVKCHSPDDLPMSFCNLPTGYTTAVLPKRRRSGAKPCTAQLSGGGASSGFDLLSGALFHNALTGSWLTGIVWPEPTSCMLIGQE